MLELTLKVTGKDVAALRDALAVVSKQVADDFTSGLGSNDDGSFSYEVSGEAKTDGEASELDLCMTCGLPVEPDPAGSEGVIVHARSLGPAAYDLDELHTALPEDQ